MMGTRWPKEEYEQYASAPWGGFTFFRNEPIGANRHGRRAYTRLGGPDEPVPVGEPETPPEPEGEEEPEEEAARAV
jgi:hypothetical protein